MLFHIITIAINAGGSSDSGTTTTLVVSSTTVATFSSSNLLLLLLPSFFISFKLLLSQQFVVLIPLFNYYGVSGITDTFVFYQSLQFCPYEPALYRNV